MMINLISFRRIIFFIILPILSLTISGDYSFANDNNLDLLLSLPYVSHSKTKPTSNKTGVIIYSKSQSYKGYNLYCSINKKNANLIDMNGKIVHTWKWKYKKHGCLNVEMNSNGYTYVVFHKKPGFIVMDWNSKILFKDLKNHFHHDVEFLNSGNIFLLKETTKLMNNYPVAYDSIDKINLRTKRHIVWFKFDQILTNYSNIFNIKKVHKRFAQYKKRYNSKKEQEKYKQKNKPFPPFDLFHTNTVSLLPDTELGQQDNRFQKGNILVCLRNISLIAIIDKETKEIVWSWGPGILDYPHMPSMLKNGNLLIFDNGRTKKWSRIIELNVETNEIVWQYPSEEKKLFYTKYHGSVQRLTNGNTLISASEEGRAFEITPEGKIVWEWINPEKNSKGETALFYRMVRIRPQIINKWLKAKEYASQEDLSNLNIVDSNDE